MASNVDRPGNIINIPATWLAVLSAIAAIIALVEEALNEKVFHWEAILDAGVVLVLALVAALRGYLGNLCPPFSSGYLGTYRPGCGF